MSVTLRCGDCAFVGAVNRVTANLRCSCGSTDLDFYEPPPVGFMEFMGAAKGPGTGWDQQRPDPLAGWSEYAGPMPGPNQTQTPVKHNPFPCQECKGTKVDVRDGGICRACKGRGVRTPPTAEAPEPMVKKHNYPSTQTTTPFMGKRRKTAAPAPESTGGDDGFWGEKALDTRRSKGFPMHEADCPECGHAPTHLVNDYKDDAWWHCPNCGPLANIDRNPSIDPYNPPKDFKPKPRQFQASTKSKVLKTGRVLTMLASVHEQNPGLDPREALGVVRYTVQSYGE